TTNIFGEQSNRANTIANMQAVFDAVVWLREVDGGNMVALAFKKSPQIDFETLYITAEAIRRSTKLKATNWVDDLYAWMPS
ncbi:MAG: spermidine synthase, partial [Oxalobacter sp.]|nr:spermidine synthase [Oxalobacter sp.]